MKNVFFALVLLSCCPAVAPQEKPPEVTMDDRLRFLAAAMFEGLVDDKPDPKVFDTILKQREQHFVAKCQICNPVAGGIRAYVAFATEGLYFPYGGKGFPAEIGAGLKDKDRDVRLKAIEAMVDRYVTRYFEKSRMTPAEKESMKSWLIQGKKFGMSAKEKSFGDFCPSCEGATKK